MGHKTPEKMTISPTKINDGPQLILTTPKKMIKTPEKTMTAPTKINDGPKLFKATPEKLIIAPKI